MNKPRATAYLLIVLCLSLFGNQVFVRAQQPSSIAASDPARGIQLYREGKIEEAIKALRRAVKQRKDDADAWQYLGLTLNFNGKAKEARKAFETAVKLRPDAVVAHTGLAYSLLLLNKSREAEREAERAIQIDPQNAEAQYIIGVVRLREGDNAKALQQAETALKIKANFAQAYLLKSQALIGLSAERLPTQEEPMGVKGEDEQLREQNRAARRTQYQQAVESLEKYLQLIPNAANANQLREQLDVLRIYAGFDAATNISPAIYPSSEVTTRARVLNKTEATYTEAARQNRVSGIVRLRAVLSFDGTVKYILVVKPLSHGLTESAVAAARRIKFEPATKDGRPVSQFVTLEYTFSVF
ncbi:MAG: TonB family protein [Pyrinomonadaceae bacterium]|nr:TonB family protein [Pyrinomonadaceae bacterium]